MHIHDQIVVSQESRGATAALGNFDGVHRGHRALIETAQKAEPGAPLGIVSFDPHPRRFFRPDAPPFLLTTPAEKARRLQALGVNHLYNLPFDATLSSMTPETFIEDVLVAGLGLRHVVVGADFHFGKARAGDAGFLRSHGGAHGLAVTIHSILEGDLGEYGSTAIRVMIEEGRCRDAARQLGCWHAVSGPVIKGDQRGRDLGYPTANLAFGEQIVPCFGIYASEVTVHDGPHAGRYGGVASIGERPTFGVNAPNFEVHLFDFKGDLYGSEITAALVARLRGEERFETAEALIAQMDKDSDAARRVLENPAVPT
ncbi:MAG: bifunctional riboflavin kinase/FAD synthetase [Pseudomonadota bacterium]